MSATLHHRPMVRLRLRDLSLSEEFETPLTHRSGRVIAFGHTRPPGYWSQSGGPRPRWPVVLCVVDGQEMRLSPEFVVLVGPERIHRRTARPPLGDPRWAKTLPSRALKE